MTIHQIFECQDCGERYTLQLSGSGSYEYNKGATREYCSKCAPRYYVPPPPPTHRWVLTDEVTPEQIFQWFDGDWDEQKRLSEEMAKRGKFHIPMRRSGMGLVKMDGSDWQDVIYARCYKMVYWVKSREVDAIYKRVKRSALDMITGGVFHDAWHRQADKARQDRLNRQQPEERVEFTVQPMNRPKFGIFFFDYKYKGREDGRQE